MSYYFPPWDDAAEPSQGSVRQFLDNLYAKFQPIEQARWNQSNIDSLFYAGEQSFINRYFNFSPQFSWQNFHFNLLQQPVNMVTGYQRQHRKSVNYEATEGADTKTADQLTRLAMHVFNQNGINEKFSQGCEQAAISGLVLLQPYLDFTSDPLQGDFRLKVWEYNSFLVDPYAREPDFSDAQFVWCQQYISKKEAEAMFPTKQNLIRPMAGSPQRYGSFYFLPENYNMARNDLMVLSYVWYQWKRKKKKLYNRETQMMYDFGGSDAEMAEMMSQVGAFEVVEVEVPTWKLAVILNDQLMFQGVNPLGFDSCPFVPNFWNYEPHLNYYDLRVRSLVRSMRDSQFLLNRRIILNHDERESQINSGWKRKEGALINEENLRKSGQGWDLIVADGYEMSDVEKIIPVPNPSTDGELAEQMSDLIFKCSGVNMETWGQEDPQAGQSGLSIMLRQAANLMVLQKYYDQWDYALKVLGTKFLEIVQNNWNAAKVGLIIGEQPTDYLFSKIYSRYHTLVVEGLNTPTQQNMQAAQLLEINQRFGREVIPASMIISKMNLQGKDEIMKMLQGQEQAQSEMQQHQMTVSSAIEEAKLKELYSKAAANVATARERHGRAESNIGLFEERLSMIGRNNSMSAKAKAEALEKLVEVTQKYGELEAHLKMNDLQGLEAQEEAKEDIAKADAKRTALANDFVAQMLSGAQSQSQQDPGAGGNGIQ